MCAFSGHDSTIAPLLVSYKVYDKRWPPFAANVIFELYENKKAPQEEEKHFVRMLYNQRVQRLPECKEFATEDGTLCPLNAFLKFSESKIPKNFAEECGQ